MLHVLIRCVYSWAITDISTQLEFLLRVKAAQSSWVIVNIVTSIIMQYFGQSHSEAELGSGMAITYSIVC